MAIQVAAFRRVPPFAQGFVRDLRIRRALEEAGRTTVLRELVASGVLARYSALDEHRARCETRPAFVRSLEAQLRTFREHSPHPPVGTA